METRLLEIRGEAVAEAVVVALVARSAWFKVEPKPGEVFHVCVKVENAAWLGELIAVETEKRRWRCSVCGMYGEDHPADLNGKRIYCRLFE